MNATHTPGPWHTNVIAGSWHILSKSGCVIASIGRGLAYRKQHEINARLLASAPDLLAALRMLVEAVETPDADSLNELIYAHVTIAKAEGKS